MKTEDSKKGKVLASALSYFMKELEVSETDLSSILGIPASTLEKSLDNKELDLNSILENQLNNIVNLLRIHKNLSLIFKDKNDQKIWLRTPHKEFGESPMSLLRTDDKWISELALYLIEHNKFNFG